MIAGTLDGFTETSPVVATALKYGAQSFGDTSLDLGLRGKMAFETDFGSIAPHFRAEFQHDLQSSGSASVSWADRAGGRVCSVPIEGADQTRVMLGAGLDLDWYGHLVGMEYQNTFGASSETQSVSMKLRERF
ncbi:autotransporter outer membrane beta-barrel domain-containing protein [Pinisolibacter sp. B13]|nr:autotransporter outer membrane beta-barrel domain-containing protein [Pinisolibacter aquiterrae]